VDNFTGVTTIVVYSVMTEVDILMISGILTIHPWYTGNVTGIELFCVFLCEAWMIRAL